jgi:hypothetical protein
MFELNVLVCVTNNFFLSILSCFALLIINKNMLSNFGNEWCIFYKKKKMPKI